MNRPVKDDQEDQKHSVNQSQEHSSDQSVSSPRPAPERFQITYESGRGYFVSIPNYEGGKVVRAEDYDRARNDGLFRAIEILKHIRLSNGDDERDAWSAICEAIKSIEAEISFNVTARLSGHLARYKRGVVVLMKLKEKTNRELYLKLRKSWIKRLLKI